LNHLCREVIEPFNVRQPVATVFHVLPVLRMHNADMRATGRHGEDHAIVIDRNKPTFGLPNGKALIAKVIHDNEHLSFKAGHCHWSPLLDIESHVLVDAQLGRDVVTQVSAVAQHNAPNIVLKRAAVPDVQRVTVLSIARHNRDRHDELHGVVCHCALSLR
jgi:hypothetical protein